MVLIFAVTLAAYLPALRGGFVWNDSDYVTAPALRSLAGLRRIWCEIGAVQQYYPVLHTAFWVEHRLWGDAPLGYHLANVLLHATAACLFGLTLRRLAVPGAGLAAVIFALHPVAVESVAWISEQKNTLSTVCYLAAGLAYLRFDRDRRPAAYALALGCYVLAILSKSVAATLPAALLVVFWWQRGRLGWRRDVVPLLPWLVLGAGVGLFTGWVERTYVGAQGADFTLGAVQRGLVAGRAIAFYLGKLLWPAHLSFIYPRWQVEAGAGWQYLYPLGVLALLAALWLYRWKHRGPLAAFLFFIGSLFPVLGFFNVYAFVFSYVADHFQYLASLGIIAAAGAAWGGWRARAGGVAAVAGVGLAVLLGTLTWRQCRMYGEADRFFQAIIDRNPDAWMAQINAGLELRARGQVAEAVGHFEAALRAKPGDVLALTNLGLGLQEEGRPAEGIARCAEAVRLQPNFAEGQNNLGICQAATGRLGEAAARFQVAIALKPGYAEAHNNLGHALAAAGRRSEAIDEFTAALRLRPDYPEARNNLGLALLGEGRTGEAVLRFQEAARLRPDLVQTHLALGLALTVAGRPGEAMAEYQTALRQDPANADAYFGLGNLQFQAGRYGDALRSYEAALRYRPAFPRAQHNLELARRAAGAGP